MKIVIAKFRNLAIISHVARVAEWQTRRSQKPLGIPCEFDSRLGHQFSQRFILKNMHEIGIIKAVLKKVEKVMKDENLKSCDTVVLEVGELSGVVPHFMEECWPAATVHSSFENTKLEMNVIKGVVRCNNCKEEFNAYECDLRCPNCGEDRKHTTLTGKQLIIKEIRGI